MTFSIMNVQKERQLLVAMRSAICIKEIGIKENARVILIKQRTEVQNEMRKEAWEKFPLKRPTRLQLLGLSVTKL